MGKNVLHIGCGAIGSHTAAGLPADVEFLLLCDKDYVAAGNVGIANVSSRDVGRRKVAVVSDHLRTHRPDMLVTELDADVSRISPGIVDSFDLVSAATDNDAAAYTICRIVSQSEKKPCIVFANCDPRSGAGQVRVLNFRASHACIGCARPRGRWEAPVSAPHSCTRGGPRASGEAARFASALQVNVIADLLRAPHRQEERAGESLIVNPTAGVALKARLSFSTTCPAFYHTFERRPDNTIQLGRSIHEILLQELFGIIAEMLGPDAFIELGDRRWSDHFFCAGCLTERAMLRLADEAPICQCGTGLTPIGAYHRILAGERRSDAAALTLSEFGLPEGDVVLGVGHGRYLYFATEISAACKEALLRRG